MGWTQRIGNLLRRERADAEIDAELRTHIEMAVEDMVRAGVPEAEAWRAARLRFGNPVLMKERTMGVDAALGLEGGWRDVRYALRQLKKAPGFTTVVIVTLALGIGANTTVFSIVDAVLLRPLPYAHPEQLVEVRSRQVLQDGAVSYPDFFDWRSQNHSFSHLVSYQGDSGTLTGVERAVHLDGATVAWGLLPLLGVRPEIGHGFRPQDEKLGTRVVLISHALWVSQFGSDPAIAGRTMHMSGQDYTIVGVMPASFRFPVDAPQNSFWTTLAVDNDGTPRAQTANRGDHELAVMGRLKPGVSIAQANAEMKTIATRLAKKYPDTNTRNNSADVQNELTWILGDTRTLLLVILGAVGLVLLIACGNVANLLLARASEREREMAMRSALGANRGRIIRQLLVESVMLGLLGGIAGCGLAFAATPAVLQLIGSSVPRAADAGVNLPVLAFALLASLAAGIVFGLAPAVASARTDLLSPLREAGRTHTGGHHRLGSLVIVGQVALGIVLTAGAGLLVTSFVHLMHSSDGFNPDHVLTFLFETPDSRYSHTRAEFYQQYFERLRALPGVESAGGSILLPMTDNDAHVSFENPEHPLPKGQLESARLDVLSDGYFHTMEIPLLAGRDFNDGDTVQSPQVMIVNRAFAEKFFPGENPLGKKLKPGTSDGPSAPPAWRTIVGVVGNIRTTATDREMATMYYLPAGQLPNWCCMYTVARTSVEPLSLEPEARKLVASMDRDIPVTDVQTLRDRIGLELAEPRFAMVLLSAFAGLALLLTVVGLYGVMMYSVARRTREIGVRLALGAARGAVQANLLRQAIVLIGLGTAIGLGATLALAPVLRAMLYGVSGRSPAVLVLVCGIVALAGLVVAWLPARRASGIQPMEALRAE
ncbi:MAG: ABC transporter permease [Acidobacteriaceae bacterium]